MPRRGATRATRGDRWADRPALASVGRRYGGDTDEAVLLHDARTGHAAAYEELVRRHQAAAYRTATMIAGAADAADVAQEALVKAYRALPRLRADAPFRPWLLAIVTNEARNRRRSTRRYGAAVQRAGGLATTETPEDPADRAVSAERRQVLLAAIRRLPERDQLVISCRYLMELTAAETAQALRCPEGTVKSRLSRALGRLRDGLDEPAQRRDPR